MAIKFARFNIQLLKGPDAEVKADQWQALLNDSAIAGYADDYEVFYLSQRGVLLGGNSQRLARCWPCYKSGL